MPNIGASKNEGPGDGLEARRAAAMADLAVARKRLARRVAAIDGDLERIDEGRRWARNAAWLVAAAAKAPRGATELVGTDWSTGEPIEVRVPLDPSKAARAQIEALFRKSKRLAAGEAIARARRAEAADAIGALSEIALAITSAETVEAIDEAIVRARQASPREMPRRSTTPGARKRVDEPLPPHRTFTSTSGDFVFVGRGAAHNDALTFQVARPHHLFLHARGVPGAHVIVPLAKNRSCPADLLIDAAHLAAHFSDARGEPIVEVTTAPRKWVRKPRGAPPGAVVVEREKVVTLRVEPERLATLLASEQTHGK